MATAKLTPPDFERCQTLVPNGHSFMTLGGKPEQVQCDNEPTRILVERKPGEDGQKGSMSVCDRCYREFLKQNIMDVVVWKRESQPKPKTQKTKKTKKR